VSVTPARSSIVGEVQAALGVNGDQAEHIVESFDDYVAKPLQANFAKKSGRDLAKRNPMIYTSRGTTTLDAWVDRALEDWETSAIEGHVGTWMEEVARIVSGGSKPGSGVDLQIDRPGSPATVELYACQAAPNTKSAGGRRSDVDALRRAAGAIRASKRLVETYIAVMHGKAKTSTYGADPNITVLGSDEFWTRVSGIVDFRARLLGASSILSALVTGRAAAEAARIKAEAKTIFADQHGNLRLDALANPPKALRRPARA
jgi:type II restriction endonuclease EcoO109I-like protein